MSLRSLFLFSAAFVLLGSGPSVEAMVSVTVQNQTGLTLAVIQTGPGPSAPAGGCPCPRPEATASDCHCLRPGASATFQLEGPKEKSPRQVIRFLPEGGVLHFRSLTIVAVDPVPPCPCSKPDSATVARQLADEGLTVQILDPSFPFTPGVIGPGPGFPTPGFRPIGEEPPPDPEAPAAFLNQALSE